MWRAWTTYLLLLGGSLILVALVVSSVWQPLIVAAVLAAALSRWHERLADRLKQRRALSSTIMTAGVVVLILLPLTVLTVIAVKQMLIAVPFVRDTLAQGGIDRLLEKLPEPADRWAAQLMSIEGLDKELAGGGKVAAAALTGAMSKTSSALINLALMLIAFHFLIKDGHRLTGWIERVLPLRIGQTHELLVELRGVSKAVLGSTLVTAAVQGTAATIGYAIAGVPQVVFFGLLTFFAAFVPSIGTAIISLPVCGLLLLLGHKWAALFLAIWSMVVVGLVDNLTKPLLMKGEMRLHGAIVFFSLVGGIFFFGAVGLLVGPLSLAFFLALVRLGRRDFSQVRTIPPDSIG